jgi:Sec-independent protein translocase protein TatA
LENDQGQIHFCNFNKFFKAIQIGNATPNQLFVRPVPDPNNTSTETISLKKQPKKRTLRTTKPIDYKEDEGDDLQQSDGDGKEDEHLAEKSEADDNADTKLPAKKRKTTPRKTKAVVQVKSEEKVQLENDIAKTIKTFKTAIDNFKKEIDHDEDKSEKSTLEEQMSSILTCWKLMKMQAESYKKSRIKTSKHVTPIIDI